MFTRIRSMIVLSTLLVATLGAAPALAASSTSPEGRMAWAGAGHGTVWQVDKHGTLITSRTFAMGADWEIKGVSHDKVLWQGSNGVVSVWTLDGALQKRFEETTSAPAAGYEAVSISLSIQNWFFCLEDDPYYYILLRPDPNSNDPVLLWMVNSDGRFVREDEIYVQNPGFEPVHFGMGGDGDFKLVWAAPDGRAQVWDMEWNSSLSPAGWLQVGQRVYAPTAIPGLVVTGYSSLVDDAGKPFDRMLYAQTGMGDAQALSIFPSNGMFLSPMSAPISPVYTTSTSDTATAYTDSRPLCDPPPPPPPPPTLPLPRGYLEKAEIYKKTGGRVYDASFVQQVPVEELQ